MKNGGMIRLWVPGEDSRPDAKEIYLDCEVVGALGSHNRFSKFAARHHHVCEDLDLFLVCSCPLDELRRLDFRLLSSLGCFPFRIWFLLGLLL